MIIHQIKIDFNVTENIKRYVYVYVLEGKYLYLIDSGIAGSQTQITEYIKSMGRDVTEVKSVFLTHSHPDHIGTAAWFRENIGCTIYAGEKERKWIENINIQYQERPIPNSYKLAGASVKVDQCLKDKDKIALEDNCILHAIETPGHSLGEISYLVDNSLFIGDCIPVKGDIPIYVNKTEVIESLNKIKALKYAVDNFYPAWDITYSNENIDIVIENAFDIVNDIEYAVGIASQESNNIKIIVKKVCQLLNKPMLEKHPLFTKTICAHIQTD